MYLNVNRKLYLLADGKELLNFFIEEWKNKDKELVQKYLERGKRNLNDLAIYEVDPLDMQYAFEDWYLRLAKEAIEDDTSYQDFEAVADELNNHSSRLLEGIE